MNCAGYNKAPSSTCNFGLAGTCKECGRLFSLTHRGRIPKHEARA